MLKKILLRLYFSRCIIIAIVMLLSISYANSKQSTLTYKDKFKIINNIYNKLNNAIGEGKQKPTLHFIKLDEVSPFKGNLALIVKDIYGTKIYFEEELFDLCQSFNSDRDNAIVFIMAHELAHYYKGHLDDDMVDDFGNGWVYTKKAKNYKNWPIDTIVFIEQEADKFAGFYSYVAGYDILKTAPKVITKIYNTYKIDDRLLQKTGYYSFQKRKSVADSSAKWLRNLIPVFDAANNLLMVKKYEQAAICYEYIKEFFPSREIQNNLGICYVHQALLMMDSTMKIFQYPLVFDSKSLLEKVPPVKTMLYDYLTKAEKCFNNAIKRDSSYYPSYINLSCVYILQKKYDSGLSLTQAILKKDIDSPVKANLLVAVGIANYYKKNEAIAKTFFEKAVKINNSDLAKFNLTVINNDSEKIYSFAKEKKEMDLKNVKIGDFDILNYVPVTLPERIEHKVSDGMTVISNYSNDIKAVLIQMKRNNNSKEADLTYCLTTNEKTNTVINKTISIGIDRKHLIDTYGEPSYIIPSVQGDNYIYERTCIENNNKTILGIIYTINSNNFVSVFTLYHK